MPVDSLLLSRFQETLFRMPDAIAFDFGGVVTSYAQFSKRIQGIRDIIESHCEDDERVVAVFATQELDTYAAILAILASGRAYVPLNPKAPQERNASCLEQAQIRTILAAGGAPSLDDWREALGVAVIRSDTLPGSDWSIPAAVGSSDLAYLLFTSGSTGVPKGVPVYHRNLNAFLHAIIDGTDWKVGPDDRVLQMFDLTFDLSIMCYALPLCVGARCVVPTEGAGGFVGVATALRRGEVTVALMVPSVLAFLERYFDEIELPQLRLSLFCGEALPARLARAWWARVPQARLVNVYGPTEATIFLSAYELDHESSPDEAYNGVVGIGMPLRGSAFRVVDESLVTVDEGVKGELVLLGDQVTTGYWRNPERTAAAFVCLPDRVNGYRSGDLVFRQHDQHHYVGRADHQIKFDGYRIEAGEIESKAREILGVRDAVLIPQRGEGRVIGLHLFVLATEYVSATFAMECRNQLKVLLPSYMVPHKVHLRQSFPLNVNGKIDRNALGEELAVQ